MMFLWVIFGAGIFGFCIDVLQLHVVFLEAQRVKLYLIMLYWQTTCSGPDINFELLNIHVEDVRYPKE